MKIRSSVLALTAAALLASGSAWAQAPLVEVADRTVVAQFGQVADDVDDWDVYSADGVEIGEVEEVIGPDRSTATHLVVEFDDDSPYGDRDDVIIPIEEFSWENGRLILNAAPEAVASMPVWDD